MHAILHPVGSHGDVHPLVGLGRELARRGHRVTLVASAPFGGLAGREGFAFAPTGTPEDYEATIHHPDVWHPSKSLNVLFAGERPARMLRAAYAAITDAVGSNVAESVVVAGSLGLAGRIARDALGVRFATVHLSPSALPSVVAPPVFPTFAVPNWWPHWLRRALYYAAERYALDPVLSPSVNSLRRELGLDAVTRIFGPWRHSPERLLLAFPDWFARAPDWPAAALHTGFPHFDQTGGAQLPPGLAAFLDAGPPPVVVSFGTAMRQAREPIRVAIQACARLGRRVVILAKSGEQVPTPLPGHAHHADYAPFSAVLPRAALLAHHGGVGTAAQALRAGIPQLIRPMAFDQADNAARLRALGVAGSVAVRDFTPERVAEALAELLDSGEAAAACARLRDRAVAEPPGEWAMADAVEALYAAPPPRMPAPAARPSGTPPGAPLKLTVTTPPEPSRPMTANPPPAEWLTPQDLYLFNEGSHVRLYEKLGAHPVTVDGVAGFQFAVWAPNAGYVSVVGDFNGWNRGKNPLAMLGDSGLWQAFVPGVKPGVCYKLHLANRHTGENFDKADPFAFTAEIAPKQASVTWDLSYDWGDADWMANRGPKMAHDAPVSIYELHLGSWMRESSPPHLSLGYRGIAPKLAEYVTKLGFTHVEFMPLAEHPFYGSWGYQITGYFSATSRYGTPQDLMYLIDYLHQRDIGVIIDWVPSHFATDEFSLARFDGSHLYEHADSRQGYHPDWGSYIFNYERHEVRSFLISNALFWLDKYHVDGIRVDAVASMLYLDYSRKEGEWIPNRHGGRENLGAIEFLRRFNHEVYTQFPGVQTIAEESTSWPQVTRPPYEGGLGFGYKWDMGWMHDTLKYCETNPLYRKYMQNTLTFRGIYKYSENFVLPLSHDEVVHGKGPLFDKMAGDDWQKFASLRLLLSYQYFCNGKKLLFMGDEIAQKTEWKHDGSVAWQLLDHAPHKGVQTLVADLNAIYRREPALHTLDNVEGGFEWIDCSDADHSIFLFVRTPKEGEERLVCAFNFTPEVRHDYRIGVPGPGHWSEVLNSDAARYWGSNVGNGGGRHAEFVPWHQQPYSVSATLPPLACVVFRGTL